MSKVELTLKTRLRFSHRRLGASNAFVIVEPYAGRGKSIEKHRTGTQPALSRWGMYTTIAATNKSGQQDRVIVA
jgi:hypothetical protein